MALAHPPIHRHIAHAQATAAKIVKEFPEESESHQIVRLRAAFTTDDGWERKCHMDRWEAFGFIKEARLAVYDFLRV
jgi:hypothetical protein